MQEIATNSSDAPRKLSRTSTATPRETMLSADRKMALGDIVVEADGEVGGIVAGGGTARARGGGGR